MTALTIDDPVYFDHLARVETDHWWHAAMWRIASGWLDWSLRGRTGLVALDVGCGAGGTMRRLAARPEIDRVLGIDPSEPGLAHASHHGAILGSALALPFVTGSVDVATCFDVLQHLPPGEDLIAMEEIHRVLRPGGVAVVRSNGVGIWPDGARADQPYRIDTLIDLARQAGLIVRRGSYANALPAVVTEVLGRIASGLSKARLGNRGPGHEHRSSHGHPQGRGLRIRTRNPLITRVMSAIATAEALAITRLNVSLPVGHSTMMLVEAPRGPRP
jgi:SAM-dependent methyltransferase